jgi:hypothetical protein
VLIDELELELIQTRMTQKPLLWVEVGKSACVLVGICELRLSPPARYDPQCASLLDCSSGCLVRVLWTCRSNGKAFTTPLHVQHAIPPAGMGVIMPL